MPITVPASPGSSTRSANMRGIRRRDTKIERAVRSELHRLGYRFRVDLPIRLGAARAIRPDIVFTRQRVAIFIDGCFWHGCPDHGSRATVRNAHYWHPKIAGNSERDVRHTAALRAAGWTVLRYWEHDAAMQTASDIDRRLRPLRAQPGQPIGQADDPALDE